MQSVLKLYSEKTNKTYMLKNNEYSPEISELEY